MQEGLQAATLKRQVAEAERLQEAQLPRIVPRAQQWDVDAWTLRGDRLGGDFYDWFTRKDDSLCLAVGSASGSGMAAAMLAGVLRTAVRTRAGEALEPQQLLNLVNGDLWQSAAGMQTAALLYAMLDASGEIRLATAGEITTLLARPAGWQLLNKCSLPLARDPNTRYQPMMHGLRPDETLLVLAGDDPAGVRPTGSRANKFDLSAIARLAAQNSRQSSKELAAALRFQFSSRTMETLRDRTLLVVKRKQGN